MKRSLCEVEWVIVVGAALILLLGIILGWYVPSRIITEARSTMPVASNPPPNQSDVVREAVHDGRTSYVRSVRIMEGDEEAWNSLDGGKVAGCECPRYILEFCPIAVDKDYGVGAFYHTKTVTIAISNIEDNGKKVIAVEVEMGKLYCVPIVLGRKKLWQIELHDARGYLMLDVDNYNRDVNRGRTIHSVGWLSVYTVDAI